MLSVVAEDKKDWELNSFINFVRLKKNYDLLCFRSTFLRRRLKIRMDRSGCHSLSEYQRYLEENPQEWLYLMDVLSVNVSELFRDPEVFDYFQENCLRKIIENKLNKGQRTIRIWSAGCSQGEEVYSLAILLDEAIPPGKKKHMYYRVWGTDIDRQALELARKGYFLKDALKRITKQRLFRYFHRLDEQIWEVKEELKNITVFRYHNLFYDPPLRYVDAIFCRNVRIYFSENKSQEVLESLYEGLKEGGYLVLGQTESLPFSFRDKMITVSSHYKIFQKQERKGG